MAPQHFTDYQLTFPRVQEAYRRFDAGLPTTFSNIGLLYPPKQIHIRIFKKEQQAEVWATDNTQYSLLKTYPLTANSGQCGPKQQEGDLQIPEGCYQITHFNPQSKFHLSLKMDYPNAADVTRNSPFGKMGGDIYIHGGNTSTGCIAIGDENMAELYWLCVVVFATHPFIPVHIFPFRMEGGSLKELGGSFPHLSAFWNSMQPLYDYFESHKMLAGIPGHDAYGNYLFYEPEPEQ